MDQHQRQLAWLGRITDALPGMLRDVKAGQRQELRLGSRRRPDGVLVKVWLVVRANDPTEKPMGTHGVVGRDAADEEIGLS